ncbi:MAG TPA: DUF222 domain-containing protein, partial [Dongiaceae bacterium]|nr:DUF222 domain-containing protein [Dongiaceae bacterium]
MTPVSAAAHAVEPPHPRGSSESVHLTADASLVPMEIMTPPFREDARGLMRDLAAFLLDRHLRRLARMRNPVDLRLGRLLADFDARSGPLALGFARLGDYVIERLGLTVRRARALVALARGLEPLPRLAAAFEAGDISRSQARVILRVATPETEAAWLDRARLLTVRRLDREVRAAMAQNAGAGIAPAEAADAEPAGPMAPVVDEDDVPGAWIDVPVPQRLRPLWDKAIELARRTSGSSDPVWACAEIIAADFIAGVPDLASLLARETEPEPATHPGCDAPPHSSLQEDTDLFEEVLGALESEVGCDRRFPPLEGLDVALPAATEPRAEDSPREIDRRLRELVRLRQNVAWHQGRLLRLFVGRRLYRELGFLSFSRYCSERAGIGSRRAWELVSLERRLWLLPRITAAYRTGALSWVRAAMIARVATDRTEAAWLHLAGSVTVRRLEEEIALAERTEEARTAGALPVGTLPIGIAPPPGLDPDGRVQMLAPSRRERAADIAGPADSANPTNPGGLPSAAGTASPPATAATVRLRFWAPL